jgi:cell division protein FtsX
MKKETKKAFREMANDIGKIILMLFGALLVGVVIGWLGNLGW